MLAHWQLPLHRQPGYSYSTIEDAKYETQHSGLYHGGLSPRARAVQLSKNYWRTITLRGRACLRKYYGAAKHHMGPNHVKFTELRRRQRCLTAPYQQQLCHLRSALQEIAYYSKSVWKKKRAIVKQQGVSAVYIFLFSICPSHYRERETHLSSAKNNAERWRTRSTSG
jgi:hypothetical protein